jgi:ubiquitin-protein ligase
MSNVKRITKEFSNFQKEGHKNMFLEMVDDNISHLRALIIGPDDTPYEGAFLYFDILLPGTYPFEPPIVKFLSPYSGEQRIHPNLYACGKVCLSILGTWVGEEKWSSLLTIEKLLMTISGLLDNNPISHEPGQRGKSESYALGARYLCGLINLNMLVRKTEFQSIIQAHFLANLDKYLKSTEILNKNMKVHVSSFHHQFAIINDVGSEYKRAASKLLAK